jgi:hypothetical protein
VEPVLRPLDHHLDRLHAHAHEQRAEHAQRVAEAYVEGAARRESAGETDAELEGSRAGTDTPA